MLALCLQCLQLAHPSRQLLFAALVGDKRSMPSCPEAQPITSSGSRPVQWTVHNPTRAPMQMFWVSFEGKEQAMEQEGAGGSTGGEGGATTAPPAPSTRASNAPTE